MKTKLCLAVLGMLVLVPMSASALACQWCDCTMDCSRSCRDTSTWQITTCGAYGGLCLQSPNCPWLTAEAGDDNAPICPDQEPAFQPAAAAP